MKILNKSRKIFICLFKCWNNKRIRMTSQSTGFIRFSWNSYKILTLNNENGIRKYRAHASTNEIFLYKLYCSIILSLLNFQGCRRLRSMFPRMKYTLKSLFFLSKFTIFYILVLFRLIVLGIYTQEIHITLCFQLWQTFICKIVQYSNKFQVPCI